MIDPSKLFAPMARAVDRHRVGAAPDKLILADMLVEIAAAIRGKPAPKMNGHHPPPTEKWTVETADGIKTFASEWEAVVYRTRHRITARQKKIVA